MSGKTAKQGYCYDYPRPAVTVDILLFHGAAKDMEILLIERRHEPFAGHWALPGGFVDKDESLEAAAARELLEETGLRRARFTQVGAFGDPGRDPRGHTVSVAFAALLTKKPQPQAADDAAAAAWHPVNRLPKMAFDHKKIIRAALRLTNYESR